MKIIILNLILLSISIISFTANAQDSCLDAKWKGYLRMPCPSGSQCSGPAVWYQRFEMSDSNNGFMYDGYNGTLEGIVEVRAPRFIIKSPSGMLLARGYFSCSANGNEGQMSGTLFSNDGRQGSFSATREAAYSPWNF